MYFEISQVIFFVKNTLFSILELYLLSYLFRIFVLWKRLFVVEIDHLVVNLCYPSWVEVDCGVVVGSL